MKVPESAGLGPQVMCLELSKNGIVEEWNGGLLGICKNRQLEYWKDEKRTEEY